MSVCGETLLVDDENGKEEEEESGNSDFIVLILLVSILCIVLICALIYCLFFRKKKNPGDDLGKKNDINNILKMNYVFNDNNRIDDEFEAEDDDEKAISALDSSRKMV